MCLPCAVLRRRTHARALCSCSAAMAEEQRSDTDDAPAARRLRGGWPGAATVSAYDAGGAADLRTRILGSDFSLPAVLRRRGRRRRRGGGGGGGGGSLEDIAARARPAREVQAVEEDGEGVTVMTLGGAAARAAESRGVPCRRIHTRPVALVRRPRAEGAVAHGGGEDWDDLADDIVAARPAVVEELDWVCGLAPLWPPHVAAVRAQLDAMLSLASAGSCVRRARARVCEWWGPHAAAAAARVTRAGTKISCPRPAARASSTRSPRARSGCASSPRTRARARPRGPPAPRGWAITCDGACALRAWWRVGWVGGWVGGWVHGIACAPWHGVCGSSAVALRPWRYGTCRPQVRVPGRERRGRPRRHGGAARRVRRGAGRGRHAAHPEWLDVRARARARARRVEFPVHAPRVLGSRASVLRFCVQVRGPDA